MKRLLMLALVVVASACHGGKAERGYAPSSGGSPSRGRDLIRAYGCGGCHTIPGIAEARGVVGPPLTMFAKRTYIAGELPNTPPNLVRWIRDPQSVEPGTAMPRLGLTDQQARDVAAYLYELR